ncbi:MAG: hypothetical protein RL441_961 [Actinomycetota bacterium]|jgi:tetratricopeptide (TPR) repeat protein
MNEAAAALGAKMLVARKALGLTQAEAASGICSASHLSLIESGRREPAMHIASQLCERLGVADAAVDGWRTLNADLEAAEVAIRLGEWTAAEERLLAHSELAEAQVLLARIDEKRGDWSAAIDRLARIQVDELPIAKAIARAHILCRCYRDLGSLHKCIEVGEVAIRDFTALGASSRPEFLELLGTLSGTYCEIGDLERAKQLAGEVLSKAQTTPRAQATSLWTKAIVHYSAGEFEMAAMLTRDALVQLEALDLPAAEGDLLHTSVWLEMQFSSDLQQFMPVIQRAESLLRVAGSNVQLASCLSTRASLESRLGLDESAESSLKECLELVGDQAPAVRARLLVDNGETLRRLGKLDQASESLREARELLEKYGAHRSAAVTWRQLAAIYEDLGQLDLAYACMKAATDLLGLGAHVSADSPRPTSAVRSGSSSN